MYFINCSWKGGNKEPNQHKFLLQCICWGSFCVSKGSTLGPLLFNIYICDLFLENSDIDIAKYADDNTPYTFSSDLDSAIF